MFRLVAHGAGTDWIDVWLGVLDSTVRPAAGSVGVRGKAAPVPVPAEAWTQLTIDDELPAEERTVWVQTIRLAGLSSGQRHELEATVGAERARCMGSTLPARLPGPLDPPFVVLLGSCFASYRAAEGLPGRTVAGLPPDYTPHVKLLIGDQVYLDNPAWEILPRARGGLATRLLRKYLDTWGQGDNDTGFAAILARGSTWFLADDHEFWNNHPNWSPLLATRGPNARSMWASIATQLFAGFTGRPVAALTQPQRFAVGPVEFYLADTRFGRQPGDAQFMTTAALDDLTDWLRAPGQQWPSVLVLAAPLFTEPSGWLGATFADRTLANFAQYPVLADAILESPRSLLVLAGDVHFGRVAVVRRRSDLELVEIVASPLALVSELVGGKFTDAPPQFPVRVGRQPRQRVEQPVWRDWRRPERGLVTDHFYTLSFTGTERSVTVHLAAWPIEPHPGQGLKPAGTMDLSLTRRPL
jgi:hypothetical protein